jgi:hypothetical protein
LDCDDLGDYTSARLPRASVERRGAPEVAVEGEHVGAGVVQLEFSVAEVS